MIDRDVALGGKPSGALLYAPPEPKDHRTGGPILQAWLSSHKGDDLTMRTEYEVWTEEEPVECEMHWRETKHYIEPGQPIYGRVRGENVEALACEDCARHFRWPGSGWEQNPGKWGPAAQ